MEEGRSTFEILTGKPTGKRPLGRPRRRWEETIREDLKEVDNVVITTKGLQDRSIHIIDGTTVENKGKLIITEIFPSVQKHVI